MRRTLTLTLRVSLVSIPRMFEVDLETVMLINGDLVPITDEDTPQKPPKEPKAKEPKQPRLPMMDNGWLLRLCQDIWTADHKGPGYVGKWTEVMEQPKGVSGDFQTECRILDCFFFATLHDIAQSPPSGFASVATHTFTSFGGQ